MMKYSKFAVLREVHQSYLALTETLIMEDFQSPPVNMLVPY